MLLEDAFGHVVEPLDLCLHVDALRVVIEVVCFVGRLQRASVVRGVPGGVDPSSASGGGRSESEPLSIFESVKDLDFQYI